MKKALACTFPEGSAQRPVGSEREDVLSAAAAARADIVSDTPFENVRYPNPPDEEIQQTLIVAQQEQQQRQQQQQEQEQEQNSVGLGAQASQERRADAYLFMQPPIQPDELMLHETNTYMTRISTLNWISPTMDFDLTDFDYNPTPSDEPYRGSSTSVNDLPNQAHATTSQTMRPIGIPSHSTPGSFPDANESEMPGTAYVDNKGARRPRNGRYANRIFNDAQATPSVSPRNCPELPLVAPEPDGFSMIPRVPLPDFLAHGNIDLRIQAFSLEQYRAMGQAFQDCCLTPTGAYHDGPFFTTELPSMSAFTTLLALYRRYFDPKVLPIIHPGLDSENTPFWVVKLAMSAVGSQYLETGTGQVELAVALHEFLRRVLLQRGAIFSTEMLTTESLSLVQSKLLNYIGLAYCGSRRLERHRTSALESLVGECITLHRTQPMVLRDALDFQDRRDWLLAESARRLCHAIWFIDSSSRYHFNTQSTLLLDFANIALPSKEDVWLAETDQMQAPVKQPTLEKVLRVLYVEKRLLQGIGDFARVLIIHGLYCQTWDVARLLDRPLLRWTPSAQKENAESQQLTGTAWLPQIPLYNQWRNAACDCLDVLHWIANSDIAKTGTENSTVLHLHFARIVLLAPYETIRQLAELLASEDIRHGNAADRLQEYCQQIQRWITDDQFKARLALVHCGVVFWHVRRYATDAFYEPTKVFLATLVVWAYGSLCPQPQQREPLNGASRASMSTSAHDRLHDGEEWSSDLDDISSIRLDRPTDDELVQIFIKRGRSIKATIMGVGNITAANGPARMLREGCKLLNTLDKWPIRHRHLHVLTRLMDVCRQDKHWLQTGSELRLTRHLASSR